MRVRLSTGFTATAQSPSSERQLGRGHVRRPPRWVVAEPQTVPRGGEIRRHGRGVDVLGSGSLAAVEQAGRDAAHSPSRAPGLLQRSNRHLGQRRRRRLGRARRGGACGPQ